jgi:hypothetical protein
MFSLDWERACRKEKLTTMLARENKGNAAGKPDKVAMHEVHDVLLKHYQVCGWAMGGPAFVSQHSTAPWPVDLAVGCLPHAGSTPLPPRQIVHSAFCYYATGGSDAFHIPLNSFTAFLDDAAIPDPDSLSIKRSDCDTIFIVANFQPDKNSPDVAVNDGACLLGGQGSAFSELNSCRVPPACMHTEHALMRFEFLEAIVRLGERRTPAAAGTPAPPAPRLCPALSPSWLTWRCTALLCPLSARQVWQGPEH